VEEIKSAEESGADFVTFSPVYRTTSKTKYGQPVGIGALATACASTHLPVLALGGINADNLAEVTSVPIAGVAGISYFQHAKDLRKAIAAIRKSKRLRD
jgi:thiamine-phosphate pyrophosphorylase